MGKITKTFGQESKKKNGPKKKIVKDKHRVNKSLLGNIGSLVEQPIGQLFRESSEKLVEEKKSNTLEKLSYTKGKKNPKLEELNVIWKGNRRVLGKGKKNKHMRSGKDEGPSFIPENVETKLHPDPVKEDKIFSDSLYKRKETAWVNRNRLLIFACRGISTRDRHLMKDIIKLLPHARTETKMERRQDMVIVNEVCQMRNCNMCVLFEGRGGRDVYMWISSLPHGPCAKFLLQNIYTMDELRFTGNCLIGSRPLLSFDETFDESVHYFMFKELLIQVFGTPHRHPKSQPFFDHVFMFSIVDNKIWFRNYQILSEDGALNEIGPRFVMNPVKIFEGSFCGDTLWENPHYVTPAKVRHLLQASKAGTYVNKQLNKERLEKKKSYVSYKFRETDEVFTGNPWEKAEELSKTTVVGEHPKGKKIATYLPRPSKPEDDSKNDRSKQKNKKQKKKFKK